jgi:lipid-A-disaccharide synthase
MGGGEPEALHLFVIAGEESGDRLGAPLMAAIAAQAGRPVVFTGVGGRAMAEQGLDSLVPIADLAINGFAAIPARLPTILRHLRTASRAVIAARPDALVIIDSPDFTHRVARRVRAAVPSIPIIDYVSPTVWAWRPGRAKAMRRYVDHVLALKPFEPAAHQRLGGPPCTYVGHPLIEQLATLRPDRDEAARREAAPPLVLVLPGSRRGEVRRHIGVFGAAMAAVAREIGAVEIVLPTVPHLLDEVTQATRDWATPPRIVVDAAQKSAGGARRVGNGDARARSRRCSDRSRLSRLAPRGGDRPRAHHHRHGRTHQPHSRREGDAGAVAAGRHAGKTRRPSRGAHRRHAGAPAPMRGARPARCRDGGR